MVLFNYSTKELTAKIVYYGPGLCGKTTNLQYIFENLPSNIHKGKMLSLATKTDRTLFFDFLPIDLGMIRGMRTRLQLYTVPGQVFYNTTRKLVLKGADGLVFVADSQRKMLDADVESFRNMEQNLEEHGLKLAEMPHILQFNKRDLPDVLSAEDLNAALNRFNAPIYEAVATTGIGVQDTLKAITRLVLNSLREKYGDGRKPADREPVRQPVFAPAPASPGAAVAEASRAARGTTRAPAAARAGLAAEAEPVLEIEAPPPGAGEPIPGVIDPPIGLGEILDVEEVEVEEVIEDGDLAEVIDDPSPLTLDAMPDIDIPPGPSPAATAARPEAAEIEPSPFTEEGRAAEGPPEAAEAEPIAIEAEEADVPVEPLPVAAAGPFEIETVSVEPSAPVKVAVAVEPAGGASASFETRAVPLNPTRGLEGSRETLIPIVVTVDGRTIHLKVTVAIHVERA